MILTAGIDVGAGTTKAVIMEEGARAVARTSRRTGPYLEEAAREGLRDVLAEAGLTQDDLAYVATTGYGRYQLPERDIQITEITCHGRGAQFLFPATRCVLDVGAQTSRAIRVNERGKVVKFRMNDRCAAGAGRFLERVCKALELRLEDLGPLSLRSEEPTTISSICAVLAESELINQVTEGRRVEDIVRGAHNSIADRIVALLRQVGLEGEITLTGGLVQNAGMVRALEERLGSRLNASPDNVFAGSLGAAILGHRRVLKRMAEST
jgi:predicted CoA-substrate-specific enzyme activase